MKTTSKRKTTSKMKTTKNTYPDITARFKKVRKIPPDLAAIVLAGWGLVL